MSYTHIKGAQSINLSLSGSIKMSFKCPRCGIVSISTILAGDLPYSIEFKCNQPSCAETANARAGFYGELRLSVQGSFLGENDRPLCVKPFS